MLYTTQKVGPMPILDIGASKITDATNPVATTLGSDLNVRLDTANLGSNTEAFTNVLNTGSTSVAASDQVSYGVALCDIDAIDGIDDGPIYLEYSVCGCFEYSVAFDPVIWVGYIKTAGASIADGWNATHNLVTDYVMINSSGDSNHVPGGNYNVFGGGGQVLLKDMVSGGLDTDKFLAVGVTLRNTSTGASTLTDVEYTISARYAHQPIVVNERG